MSELQVFTNPEFGQVRTVTIEEEPWFVGKDVAVALGYENPQKAVRTQCGHGRQRGDRNGHPRWKTKYLYHQ